MELGLRSSLGSMLAVIGLQWLLAGPAIGGPSIPTNVDSGAKTTAAEASSERLAKAISAVVKIKAKALPNARSPHSAPNGRAAVSWSAPTVWFSRSAT